MSDDEKSILKREQEKEKAEPSSELNRKVKNQIKLFFENKTFHSWSDIESICKEVREDLEIELGEEIEKGWDGSANSYRLFNFFENNINRKSSMHGKNKQEKTLIDLRVVELICQKIQGLYDDEVLKIPREAFINQINKFLEESSVCFNYSMKKTRLIRVGNPKAHDLITKKAISLISQYEDVDKDFYEALEHYRYNRNRDCINRLSTSIETLLRKYIENKPTDSVSDLAKKFLKKYKTNEPHHLHVLAFSQLLETVKTPYKIRSKSGAHTPEIEATKSLTEYAIHLTASNLIFIIEFCKEQEVDLKKNKDST